MKKKIVLRRIVLFILLIILLIPFPLRYKDGGTVKYLAVLYSVTNYHSMNMDGGYDTGIQIKVIGISIYDNTTFDD